MLRLTCGDGIRRINNSAARFPIINAGKKHPSSEATASRVIVIGRDLPPAHAQTMGFAMLNQASRRTEGRMPCAPTICRSFRSRL